MKEKTIYEIIKRLVENKANKKRAAIRLGCTERYVNKLITKYRTEGKAGFVHKNSGRQPKATISKETKERIICLYKNKYYSVTNKFCNTKLSFNDSI